LEHAKTIVCIFSSSTEAKKKIDLSVYTYGFLVRSSAVHREHEIEIGYPTDVRHVSHIGLGGSEPCPKWVRIFIKERKSNYWQTPTCLIEILFLTIYTGWADE
jgi:hypothetical protein